MITRATLRLSDGIFWNTFHPGLTEASVPMQATIATGFSPAKTPRYKATVMVPILVERIGIREMLGRRERMQNTGKRDRHS